MSRNRYDHFHCIYELDDGQSFEIEGGLNSLPESWNDMPKEERRQWIRRQAIAWGMPANATIKSFHVAG
jgi:hypothetical protein